MARTVDPAADDISVRRDAVRAREHADEVAGVGAEQAGGLVDGERVCEAVVQHGPQFASERRIGACHDLGSQLSLDQIAETQHDALRDERLARPAQCTVDLLEHRTRTDAGDGGATRGTSDDGCRQPRVVEVQDAFPERGSARLGLPVVRDVRRQDGDAGRIRTLTAPVEVIDDSARVDRQHCPGIVCVRGVGVFGKGRVQDFSDERNTGAPRLHALDHARNVQDRGSSCRDDVEVTSDEPVSSPVRFDTKVVVVLRDDLLPWQELNVTAFLMSGVATSEPGLTGEAYRDADDVVYLPMLRQPVVVMSGDATTLAATRERAVRRGLPFAIYTAELFASGHDAANRAAVAAVPTAQLDLVGVAMRGPKNVVDRIVKGARMHA